ncbi:MAG TPA: hypothetical protein VFL83_14485 [Anaeromyxobacter sp.]|nr:hypothetical protein [Anaeromyxobacter sp.]
MERPGRTGQRLVAVFTAGVILLNYPILFLFARPVSAAGVPILYLYVFGAWTALIAALAYVIERSRE